MDNFSSLGSDLPKQTVNGQELDAQLVKEFKTAACAVTQLFKLSGTRTTAAKEEGYLQAIQDLLTELNDSNGTMDVVQWAIKKKSELTGEPLVNEPQSQQAVAVSSTSTSSSSSSNQRPARRSSTTTAHHEGAKEEEEEEGRQRREDTPRHQHPHPQHQHQHQHHHENRDMTPFTFASSRFQNRLYDNNSDDSSDDDQQFQLNLDSNNSIHAGMKRKLAASARHDKRRRPTD